MRILLQGLKRKNELPEKVIVCDPNSSMHENLKDLSIPGLELNSENEWDNSTEIIFLAVHPPS